MTRQTFAQATAVADSIAAKHSDYSPDMMGFDWFSLDMSLMMVKVDDGIWFSAMVETRMMKASERQLWTLKRKQAARMESGKPDLSGHYANGETFEVDCNPITLAIGLAQAFKVHPLAADECEGDPMTIAEVLDLNRDSFAELFSDSNAVSNRKAARKHDRSRVKAND